MTQWIDAEVFRKFEKKYGREETEVIANSLQELYSGQYGERGFDMFFNNWCFYEDQRKLSQDEIMEISKRKAEEYDKKFFMERMKEFAGQKKAEFIMGSMHMNHDYDEVMWRIRRYKSIVNDGGDKEKLNRAILSRYAPNNSGRNGNHGNPGNPGGKQTFWGNAKKYGKKARNWGILAGVGLGLVGTCYVSKLNEYKQKEPEPQKIELKKPVPAPMVEEKIKLDGYANKSDEVILSMPQSSRREGSAKSYRVMLPVKEISKDREGNIGVRIRQGVKPAKGIDKIGIRTEAGWSFADSGEEEIFAKFTPGELGNYLTGEDINFQAAAFKKLPDGKYMFMGSYVNGIITRK